MAGGPGTGWAGAPGARVRVGGPGPTDWMHTPLGSYRVGYQQPAAAAHPGASPQQPGANLGWAPPPIPAGYYNPIRDIELSEGQRGSEQSITGLERQKTNAENTYATNLGVLQQREAQQEDAAKQTLARLAESYAKLGGRQGEQANRLGVVNGGALIASAGKRAANEAVQREAQERARKVQLQQDENERGRLATAQSQLTGPGGSLTEAMQNARANQQAFAQSVGTLKGNEAAQHGYIPVKRPWTHTALGSVRVGGKY